MLLAPQRRARPLVAALVAVPLAAAAGWVSGSFRLDLAVMVFAAAYGVLRVGLPAAVAACTMAMLHRPGWSTAVEVGTGLLAAGAAVMVLRRALSPEAVPSRVAARLILVTLAGLVAATVHHALQDLDQPWDLPHTLTIAAGYVGGLALGTIGWWLPDRRRVGSPLVFTAAVAAVTSFALITTVSFWSRTDEQILNSAVDSVAVSFSQSVIDEMNILATKASTSAEQDFTAATFEALMQTIVFGHEVIGGAELLDMDRPGGEVVSLSSVTPLGEEFQQRLQNWVVAAGPALSEVARTNAIGYIGSTELPEPDGSEVTYLMYAAPLRNPDGDPNATMPTRFMVSAMSVRQLMRQAIAPTPAARDEVHIAAVGVTGDTLEPFWSTSPDVAAVGTDLANFTEVTGERAIAAASLGPTTVTLIAVPGHDMGTPTGTRALVVTLEAVGGLLLCGAVLLTGDQAARRERERRRREGLLSAALQGSAGWTAIVDHEDVVVMSNGDRHGAPTGDSVLTAPLWAGDRQAVDEAKALLRDARAGNDAQLQHVWSDPNDPSHAMRIFEVQARPLPYQQLVYLQCVDVTEHRDRAMRTAQSERMEAIGVLAGGLAHDFNNLLFITLGYLQMLERLPSINGDTQSSMFVTRAIEAVERGATVAKSLLAFARSQPLTSVPVNLRQFITELRPLIEQALGSAHRLEVHADGEHLDVVIDPGRLSSSILNTVFNARDAMDGPGTVEIRIERCVAAPVDGTAANVIAISIIDSGRGMSPDVVARAFEPFFTTKQLGSGTGLGLSTLYSFAQQSGGWAAIDSTEGVGTTVTLFLPPAVEHTGPAVAARAPRTATRALVVDDEQALGELVASWLDDLGMTTKVATSPDQALSIAEEFRPELLVSDANLGTAIDGLELARMLVQRDPALLVVFMTGFSDRIRALQAAGVATLAKPFSRDDLVTALSVHLGDRFEPQQPRGGRP